MTIDYLGLAAQYGTPLIEGNQVIFVWQGKHAPNLIGDFTGWENGEPVTLENAGRGVWIARLDFPLDAYVEYIFWQDGERLFDPFNKRKTSNGMGKYNHTFIMPEAEKDQLSRRKPGVPQGNLTTGVIDAGWFMIGGKRPVHFYQPPVLDPVPLVVVWDGKDYLHRARLPVILDNLIAQHRIQPVALAMVDQSTQGRGVEYLCSEAGILALLRYILPEAINHLNLLDVETNPGAYGVMGASAGGLMALYTSLRLPEIFGKVLSQSGAFSFGPFDLVVWDLVHQIDPGKLKIWLDVGKFEWLLECNQRMAALMEARKLNYTMREFSAGHNYPAWRNDLWRGLEFLFGKTTG